MRSQFGSEGLKSGGWLDLQSAYRNISEHIGTFGSSYFFKSQHLPRLFWVTSSGLGFLDHFVHSTLPTCVRLSAHNATLAPDHLGQGTIVADLGDLANSKSWEVHPRLKHAATF
eukprot:s1353_g7.t1